MCGQNIGIFVDPSRQSCGILLHVGKENLNKHCLASQHSYNRQATGNLGGYLVLM